MNRRQALARAMALVAAGSLGACAPRTRTEGFFRTDELAVVEEVCDAVLPATDTPGARAAGVHRFIESMMMDWASDETQDGFRRLVHRIDDGAKDTFGSGLVKLSPQARAEAVRRFDAAAFAATDRDWRRFKELILLGYYTSEIGATQELRWEAVPGEWRPCEPLKADDRTWVD